MAAGRAIITIKDAGNVTQNVFVESDTGLLTGNLSFLQSIVGADGGNITSAANPFPTTAVLGASALVIGKVGIDQTTPGTTNGVSINQINGTAIVTGGVNGSQGIGGLVGGGLSVAGTNPVLGGGRAQSSEPSAVTGGTAVNAAFDLTGKQIISPYANRENMVRGSQSATGTGATVVIATPGAGIRNYITSLQLSNTSATTVIVTMNDTSAAIFIVPAGGGSNLTFPVPLVCNANTALTFTVAGGATTIYCSAQGFIGI